MDPEYVVDLHTSIVHLTNHSSFFFSWSFGFLLFCCKNGTISNLKNILLLHMVIRSFSIDALLPFYLIYNCCFVQVGLNNIKETDFVNVTIQSLMRVTPLRNFFLIPENYQHSKSPLVHRFGELTRKIWHARNFKGQVGLLNHFAACFMLPLCMKICLNQ